MISFYWYWFKYFLLGISLSLFIILSQGKVGNTEVPTLSVVAQTVNPQTFQQNQARTLTEKGHSHLNQGRAVEALQTWQAATEIYGQLHNLEGVAGSLVNQSLALQSLGLYPRACTTLIQALDLSDWVCQSPLGMEQVPFDSGKLLVREIQAQPNQPVRVIGLRNLGDVLRLIGKPDESEIVLQQALFMAKRLALGTNDILLSLGNTERTLYSRARDRYQTTSEPVSKQTAIKLAQNKVKTALDLYQQVTDSTGVKPSGTALQARLNFLSLFLELERSAEVAWNDPEIKGLQSKIPPKIKLLLEQLLSASFSELPAIQSIYARLNFANTLMLVGQSVELKHLISQTEKNPWLVALQVSQSALQSAQSLSNIRARAYAVGTIGKLYLQKGQLNISKQYFEEALPLAQSIQAWDIAYQWQQQLGSLYEQLENHDASSHAYEAAVNSLDKVRGNILSINSDIQFSFTEKIAPVYRDYIRLLLSEPNPNLQKVIQVNEKLQKAELENFLQCGQLDLVSLSQVKNFRTIPTVIHILNLEKQIEVIVQSPNQELYHYSPNAKLVKSNINDLLLNLQNSSFLDTDEQVILSHSQPLYNLLIAPAKEKGYLPKAGTLVFVLDSSLQSLPMSVLHDGQKYLIEQYSISMTLGSQLREPKVMPVGQKALIAGLSRVSPSFQDPRVPRGLTPLPEVEIEVKKVKENVAETVDLLNEKFTSEQFQANMIRYDFGIIHITTHGQFSSDPERTVLLAWDKLIDVNQLNRLLRAKAQSTQDSIELLVLSACETAKGDQRSALGIAGVAAQAGARSTVASLWLVDTESTAVLMSEFYRGLHNGESKAEALRLAQLILLRNPEFQNPYLWAPFILVGSWL